LPLPVLAVAVRVEEDRSICLMSASCCLSDIGARSRALTLGWALHEAMAELLGRRVAADEAAVGVDALELSHGAKRRLLTPFAAGRARQNARQHGQTRAGHRPFRYTRRARQIRTAFFRDCFSKLD
jgi:hypothetical protein